MSDKTQLEWHYMAIELEPNTISNKTHLYLKICICISIKLYLVIDARHYCIHYSPRKFMKISAVFQMLKKMRKNEWICWTCCNVASLCCRCSLPAVVGAGIGGTAAAFYLRQEFGAGTKIDVYEPGDVGGRLATVKIGDHEYEMGGAVIHPLNLHMKHFIEKLGKITIS